MDSLTEGAIASGMKPYNGLVNQVKNWLGKWGGIEEAIGNAQDFRINPVKFAAYLHETDYYSWLYGYHALFYDLGYTREELSRTSKPWYQFWLAHQLAEWKPIPPKEAIKKFSKWDILTRPEFDKLDAYSRATTLTAAGMTASTIQRGLRPALLSALKQGITLREFKKQVGGEGGKFMNDFHAETVFRTNVNKAYNQGHTEAIFHPEIDGLIPGVMFRAIIDPRTTAICSERNGQVYSKEMISEFGIMPPCHFNCRSTLIPADAEDVEKRGFGTMPTEPASQGFGVFERVGVKSIFRITDMPIEGLINPEDLGIGSEFYEDFTYGGYMDYTDDGIKFWRPFTKDEVLALQKKEIELVPLRDAKYIEAGKTPPTAKPQKPFPDIEVDEIKSKKYDTHHDYYKPVIKDGKKIYVTEETAEKYVVYTKGKTGPGEWIDLKPKVKPEIVKPKPVKPEPVPEPTIVESVIKPESFEYEKQLFDAVPELTTESLDNMYASLNSSLQYEGESQYVTVIHEQTGEIFTQNAKNNKAGLMKIFSQGSESDYRYTVISSDYKGVLESGKTFNEFLSPNMGKRIIAQEGNITIYKKSVDFTVRDKNKFIRMVKKVEGNDYIKALNAEDKLAYHVQQWNNANPKKAIEIIKVTPDTSYNKKLFADRYDKWAVKRRAELGYSLDDIKIVDDYEHNYVDWVDEKGLGKWEASEKAADYGDEHHLTFSKHEVKTIEKTRWQTDQDGLEDGILSAYDGEADILPTRRKPGLIQLGTEDEMERYMSHRTGTPHSCLHTHPESITGKYPRELGGSLSDTDVSMLRLDSTNGRVIATDNEYTYIVTAKYEVRKNMLAESDVTSKARRKIEEHFEIMKKTYYKTHAYSDEIMFWDEYFTYQKQQLESVGYKLTRIRNADLVEAARKKGVKVKQFLSSDRASKQLSQNAKKGKLPTCDDRKHFKLFDDYMALLDKALKKQNESMANK